MAVHLARVVTELEAVLKSPRVLVAAADALEDTMRTVTARAIGGDLRLSGFRGAPVEFTASFTAGAGEVSLPLKGGTYALADAGRRRAKRRIRSKRRKRRGRRAPALRTPAGPRRSVRGSRWRGFRLTETGGPLALNRAVKAAGEAAVREFALAA